MLRTRILGGALSSPTVVAICRKSQAQTIPAGGLLYTHGLVAKCERTSATPDKGSNHDCNHDCVIIAARIYCHDRCARVLHGYHRFLGRAGVTSYVVLPASTFATFSTKLFGTQVHRQKCDGQKHAKSSILAPAHPDSPPRRHSLSNLPSSRPTSALGRRRGFLVRWIVEPCSLLAHRSTG